MGKLSIEELNDFLEELFERLKQEARLYNQQSEFDTFLERYQFEKNDSNQGHLYNDKAKDINGIFKKASLKDRYEIVEYDDLTNFDISTLENSTQYTDVFIGAVPHKMRGIGDTDNPVQTIMDGSETIYPKIHKLMTSSGLKITKTNLTDAIASSVIFDNTRVITS